MTIKRPQWPPKCVKRRRVARWHRKAAQRQQRAERMAQAMASAQIGPVVTKRIERDPSRDVHLITNRSATDVSACDFRVLEHVDESGETVVTNGARAPELLSVTCKQCIDTDEYYEAVQKFNVKRADCCFGGKGIGWQDWLRAVSGRGQWRYYARDKERSGVPGAIRIARWRGNHQEIPGDLLNKSGSKEWLCFRGHWAPEGQMMPNGYREFRSAIGADDLVYRLNRGVPPPGFLIFATLVAGSAVLGMEACDLVLTAKVFTAPATS